MSKKLKKVTFYKRLISRFFFAGTNASSSHRSFPEQQILLSVAPSLLLFGSSSRTHLSSSSSCTTQFIHCTLFDFIIFDFSSTICFSLFISYNGSVFIWYKTIHFLRVVVDLKIFQLWFCI